MLKRLRFFTLLLGSALGLICLGSCNRFIKMTDSSYYEKVDPVSGADHLKIVFSHNINGETHPCGCRKFPLGGLPQAAGYLYEARKSAPVVYIDSGDMLFPSPQVPGTLKNSVTLTADKLAQAQEMLGLKYFLPGDQDFALGVSYLAELSKKSSFSFIATNMRDDSPIKHKKSVSLKAGEKEILLLGVINPDLMQTEASALLTSPAAAIQSALKEVKAKEGSLNKKTIILLSHSGLDFDKELAKKFPEIDWIIGSHSQSFLREAELVKEVKIVQALSRNHYLGEISIPFNTKKESSYKLVPISEGLEKKMPENKMIPWLEAYKSQLDQAQKDEQSQFMADGFDEKVKFQTYNNCMECHKEQTEFWQKTPHSLAWQTLEQAKASNNPQCIGCHSLGYQDPKGFATTASIVQGSGLTEKKLDAYMAEVKETFKGSSSIRKMSSTERKKLSDKWIKLDEKHGVEKNFANVQCLHCHSQSSDHPFDIGSDSAKPEYAESCLKCHNADQSPEWYNKDTNGLATTPNKKYVEQKIKQMSCPKM